MPTFAGTNTVCELRKDMVVLKQRSAGGIFKRAVRMAFDAYKDPDALVAAFDGPRRTDLLAVLRKDSHAFAGLWSAVRARLSDAEKEKIEAEVDDDDQDGSVDRLVAALRMNRDAVVATFREERSELAGALKGKAEAFEILTATYIPRESITSVTLGTGHDVVVTIEHESGSSAVGFDNADAARSLATTLSPADSEADAAGPHEIEKLAELHRAGILTDEEFTAAKRKALGI